MKGTRRDNCLHCGQKQCCKGSDKVSWSRGGGWDCKIPAVLSGTCISLVHGNLIRCKYLGSVKACFVSNYMVNFGEGSMQC